MDKGNIRFNRTTKKWEMSSDGYVFEDISSERHTHPEMSSATSVADAGTIVKRDARGASNFSEVLLGVTSKVGPRSFKVGAFNKTVDPDAAETLGGIISGYKTNFKTNIDDGSGRISFLWNVSKGSQGKYLAVGEPALRLTLDISDQNKPKMGFFVAPAVDNVETAVVTWEQVWALDGAQMMLGALNDPSMHVKDGGDAELKGNWKAKAFTTTSLRNAKKNITPYTSDALALIRALDICSFLYKDEEEGAPSRVGIIADDVSDVSISGQNHDSFNVSNTLGILIKAFQQSQETIIDLENRIEALESSNTSVS
jgi:hypothetical protein